MDHSRLKNVAGAKASKVGFVEALERRLLFSVGDDLGPTYLFLDVPGTASAAPVSPGVQRLDIKATGAEVIDALGGDNPLSPPAIAEISILVNSDGTLNGGVAGDDLNVYLDNDNSGDFSFGDTTLMTGEVSSQRFSVSGVTVEAVFQLNNSGAWATDPNYFQGSGGQPVYAGISIDLLGNNVPLDFTQSFSDYAPKGALGSLLPATIGDFVWNDTNANGIQDSGETGVAGATVQLFNSSNVQIGASQVTGPSGAYLFTNLIPDDYYVKVTPPAGYVFSPQDQGSDDSKDSDANTVTGKMALTTLSPGEDDRTWDAGLYKPGQLSGYVYDDCSSTVSTSNNGIKDAGEAGIGNATTYTKVELLNSGGTVIATTYTNSSGFYSFTNLVPGTYSIRETQPAGYLDGKDKIGTQGGTAGNDLFTNIVVLSGTNGTNNNFGELSPASLSGYVYDDLNNDGVFNSPVEEGIPGVTVTLTGMNDLGASVTLTTVTDANGLYTFANLRPGTYQLKETQPLTFVDGKDTIGTPGGTTTNDTFSNIVLNCDVKGANNNFGELGLLHGLTGTIGFWANKNGQQMIKLLNVTSTLSAGTSTALGSWLASNFPKIYGVSGSANYFKGKTTAAIASRFMQLKDVQGQKTDAQLLALCMAIYTTTKELNSASVGQAFATQHSFVLSSQLSSANLKNKLWNVGANGEAFATKSGNAYVTADNTSLSVWTLLQRTNGFAANGVLWSSPLTVNSVLYTSTTLQNQGNVVFSSINQAGDIIS